MTREDILAMAAGIELDNLLAKTIFNGRIITKPSTLSDLTFYALVGGEELRPLEKGKTLQTVWWRHTDEQAWQACPYYSTDISAAWEVVEKMRTTHKQFITIIDNPHLNYDVRFSGSKSSEYVRLSNLPHAICRAALLTVLEESL